MTVSDSTGLARRQTVFVSGQGGDGAPGTSPGPAGPGQAMAPGRAIMQWNRPCQEKRRMTLSARRSLHPVPCDSGLGPVAARQSARLLRVLASGAASRPASAVPQARASYQQAAARARPLVAPGNRQDDGESARRMRLFSRLRQRRKARFAPAIRGPPDRQGDRGPQAQTPQHKKETYV